MPTGRLSARQSFVTHLECAGTAERLSAEEVSGLSPQGWPLLVRYDLSAVRRAMSKDALRERAPDMWRYRELLPLRDFENRTTLGEIMTPLLAIPRRGRKIGCSNLFIKDEGRLPTGSFKARGLAVAVSMARELGIRRVAMPSAGNAGAALAAYCSRAGLEAFVFCPDETPEITLSEIAMHGATVYRVNGNITEIGPIVEGGRTAAKWFSVATLKEPYRVEGKKTMGLELAEQFNWELPDVIFYPTGGGTGLIGMWKVFDELEAIGWIGSKRPRMVAVQSEGCAPIVRAFERGETRAEAWTDGDTRIPGLRVPATIGDFLVLRAVRESGGFAIAVADDDAERKRCELAREDGVHLSPEGAATLAACEKAVAEGRIEGTERIVLFNCASGMKYPMPPVTNKLDRLTPIDYAAILRSSTQGQ